MKKNGNGKSAILRDLMIYIKWHIDCISTWARTA